MRLFGFEITRAREEKSYLPAYGGYGEGGWFPVYRSDFIAHEPFTGAWQRNMELRGESVLGFAAVYACVNRISTDIAKLPLLLATKDSDGIWTETRSNAFSPVIRKPNHYQTTGKFVQQWIISRLLTGNAFIYLERDNRGIVVAMYVLDPRTTKTLVSDDGEIYYQLARDNLAGITEDMRVSARDLIHDRLNPMFHPLCGVSPLSSSAISALQGLAIQRQSLGFFQNAARPSLFLSAPGRIDDATAKRLQEYFQNAYSGLNAGKVAMGGDGLTLNPLTMNAVEAEIINQFKMTNEQVCSSFSVPAFMVGFGEVPKYDNIEAQIRLYYSQGLHHHIKDIEDALDVALGITEPKEGIQYGAMFDLDALFDMDTFTLLKSLAEGVRGIMTSNEARKKLNLGPRPGGDQVMTQQQNASLEAIAKRDSKPDPFGTAAPAAAPSAPDDEEEVDDEDVQAQAQLGAWLFKTHWDRIAA